MTLHPRLRACAAASDSRGRSTDASVTRQAIARNRRKGPDARQDPFSQFTGKLLAGNGTLAPDPEDPLLAGTPRHRGELEAAIAAFIDHTINRRYHESTGTLTPADVSFSHGETILAEKGASNSKPSKTTFWTISVKRHKPKPMSSSPSI